MPRVARLIIPGYLYHVTQRGNFRQNVFEEDQDRAVYLKYIHESSKKADVKIYAYCLMDNHVHFVVRPYQKNSMAELFKLAHMKYAHYFNRKKRRKGHLWQGRFYSCMVVDLHVKEVFRYVENNPVRAGMVKRAWQYSWSSARAHLGKKYSIIELADISEYLDIKSWKKYLMQTEGEGFLKMVRDGTRKGLVLAPAKFIDTIEIQFGIKINRKSRGRPKNSVCP